MSTFSDDMSNEVETALRALQKYDELIPATTSGEVLKYRYLLIAAETALGEALGLTCTGEPDGWNEDGSVAYYSHNGETCPVHEWLDESDHAETERIAEREALRREARQEALLDAGPILAEHNRLKGE